MKKLFALIPLMAALSVVIGCADNGPAFAEDAAKKFQSLPPEQRFESIKKNKGMSPAMKERAIDNLPVSSDQKAKWKQELGVQGAIGGGLRSPQGGAAPATSSGNPMPGANEQR